LIVPVSQRPQKPWHLRTTRSYVSISDMKTIVISIDSATLDRIDRIAGAAERGHLAARRKPNRSRVVRRALQEFVLRHEAREREARDRQVLETHRDRLRRQVEALVAEQADF